MNQTNNELAERYADFRKNAIEKRALKFKKFLMPKLEEAANDCNCFLWIGGNDFPDEYNVFRQYQDARDALERQLDGVKVERTESKVLFGHVVIVGLNFSWETGDENPQPQQDEPEMRKENSLAQHIKIENAKIDSVDSVKRIAAQLADLTDHKQAEGGTGDE